MRVRITAIAAVVTTIVLAVAAVAVVALVRDQLVASLDRSLEQRADAVTAALRADPTAVDGSRSDDRFVQVLAADGSVLLATDGLEGVPALASPPPSATQEISTVDDVPLDDDAYRVLIREAVGADPVGFVVVGESVDDVHEGVRSLIVTLAIVFPLAVGALVALVWWLVGRTLRPVEEIRRRVDSIGLSELDRRVPSPGTGDEIDRLAGTMNEMLARLEAAASVQRRFVADVSHELRTPLTRLRTTLEVDLGRDDADLERAGRDALRDAIEMQALIDDLLLLAHRDAGTSVVVPEPVDLDVVIDTEVRAMRPDLRPGVRIDMSNVTGVACRGDRRQLARLVRNLLANAVRHAEGLVEIGLSEDGDTVVVRIDDDGPGIPESERERVFDRFVRLDESRSARDGGTGLGLAIAREIAGAHGGWIRVETAPIGGCRFELRLPASAAGDAPPA